MIFYCIYIVVLLGKDGIKFDDLDFFYSLVEMKKVIERFGMSMSKDLGGKFVEVFQKLEKKLLELSLFILLDIVRGLIVGLVRDFIMWFQSKVGGIFVGVLRRSFLFIYMYIQYEQ